MRTARENAHRIRTSILKYLMVRRTRKEIENYFADDLNNQNLSFPAVEDPEPLFYQLNGEENEIFNRTVELLTQRLKYARYTPMLYYTGEDTPDQVGDTGPKEHGALYENPAGQTAGQQLSRVPKLDCPLHCKSRAISQGT